MIRITLLFSILLLGLFACKPKDQNPEDIQKSAYLEDKNQVKVMVLQQSTFTKQLVSNGKLAALRKSELKFRVSDEIASIAISNGQKVQQGATIAELTNIEYQQKVEQAETGLAKARLDLQDVLIGMGFELENSANIPKEKMELAKAV